MLEPNQRRVYDGCCGSGGMFVQSERFIEMHNTEKVKFTIFTVKRATQPLTNWQR